MNALLVIVMIVVLSIPSGTKAADTLEESVSFGRFGKVVLYHRPTAPAHVVIFVSGDGGWNKGVVGMARSLVSLNSAVIGVDIVRYLRGLETSGGKCLYPAADFEELSKFIQRRLLLPDYIPPVLVGYSSGATLVYGLLAQAPPTTFLGAISLGFCPDLETSRPLCTGYGLNSKPLIKRKGFDLAPGTHLTSPWIAFQGMIDQVCSADVTRAFVEKVQMGEFVLLPKVGHGFSVERNWMPQFRGAFARIVNVRRMEERKDDLKDLPLIEVRMPRDRSRSMAIVISGDGGWAGIDRQISEHLSQEGVPVVGLNSLRYFWNKKTPSIASADLTRIIRYYLTAWKKDSVILIGYSFGADVLPLMADGLAPDLRNRVDFIALLNPGRKADFEFHFSDWLGRAEGAPSYPVLPVIDKLQGIRVLCLYASEEKNSLCAGLHTSHVESVRLQGGHHFGGDYKAIAEVILRAVKLPD